MSMSFHRNQLDDHDGYHRSDSLVMMVRGETGEIRTENQNDNLSINTRHHHIDNDDDNRLKSHNDNEVPINSSEILIHIASPSPSASPSPVRSSSSSASASSDSSPLPAVSAVVHRQLSVLPAPRYVLHTSRLKGVILLSKLNPTLTEEQLVRFFETVWSLPFIISALLVVGLVSLFAFACSSQLLTHLDPSFNWPPLCYSSALLATPFAACMLLCFSSDLIKVLAKTFDVVIVMLQLVLFTAAWFIAMTSWWTLFNLVCLNFCGVVISIGLDALPNFGSPSQCARLRVVRVLISAGALAVWLVFALTISLRLLPNLLTDVELNVSSLGETGHLSVLDFMANRLATIACFAARHMCTSIMHPNMFVVIQARVNRNRA